MQQINLYKPPPPPEEVKLPLIQVVILLIVWIGILGSLSFLDFLDNRKFVAVISKLQADKAVVERDLGLLRANMPQEQQEESLLQKAENLGKIKTVRERMFVELNKLGEDEQVGFANYFYALSRFDINGIWLTKFKFFNAGKSIVLEGQSVDAALVPELMQKLGADPIFKGKRFSSLDISMDESDNTVVNFTLHSD